VAGTKLNLDIDFEGLVIVFTCAEADFRTAWAVNKVLKTALAQKEEIALSGRIAGKEILYSRFEYVDEVGQKTWRMLSNRSEFGFLVPEYKKFDYLLLGLGEFYEGQAEYVLEMLRSVRFITSAFSVPYQTIKAKELLLM